MTIGRYSALSTAGQLPFHLGAAMNMGLSDTQMKDFVSVLEAEVARRNPKLPISF